VVAFAGDEEIASDAVAEAFAQCLRRGSEVRSPKSWLWKASFRIAAGELKRQNRSQPPAAVDRSYEMPERDHDVLAAVAALPPMQRAAVILKYYADYDSRAVADVLGCSPTTARVHLSRARRTLASGMDMS
jgi:RNA polymerase sigma factor (sigma-70 family)